MPLNSITQADIQSADWSLALDLSTTSEAFGSGIGNVVQGVADINQCIGIILFTPPGSDPFRPTFACDMWKWLDKPIDVARPNIVKEVVEAITKWEPRVRVLSVQMNLVAGTLSNMLLTLVWQLIVDTGGIGQQQLTLSIPRGLAGNA